MAGRPRRKKKVRTAAQRAALKKAQAASARKRRRRRGKKVAGQGARVIGSFLGAALTYNVNNYIRKPGKARKDFDNAKGNIKAYRQKRYDKKYPKPTGVVAVTNWAKRGYL